MRWSAVPTVEAAREAGLDVSGDVGSQLPSVVAPTPASCPPTQVGDRATTSRSRPPRSHLAVRRHAGRQQVVFSPDGRLVERSGKDLREVDLLVGSGGVLRHNARADALARARSAAPATTSRVAGWCRASRGSSSTTTTCWPPPACSPPTTRQRRTRLLAGSGRHRRLTASNPLGFGEPTGPELRRAGRGIAAQRTASVGERDLFGVGTAHAVRASLERDLLDEERDHEGDERRPGSPTGTRRAASRRTRSARGA